MSNEVDVAIAALEVLLFELLGCESGDAVKITAGPPAESPDGVTISSISVTRGERKLFFMDADPLVLDGTFHVMGSYFVNAARNFVLEVIQPAYRHHLHSVGKLMAFTRETDLEAEFQKEDYRLQKEKRLGQQG